MYIQIVDMIILDFKIFYKYIFNKTKNSVTNKQPASQMIGLCLFIVYSSKHIPSTNTITHNALKHRLIFVIYIVSKLNSKKLKQYTEEKTDI